MRMIISPAKQMRVDTDTFTCKEHSVCLDRTKTRVEWLRGIS